MSETTIETEIRPCKHVFTPEELREIAEKMAESTQKLQSLEEEKKAVAASFKEQCEQVQLVMRRAARKYRLGYEMRNVECVVQRDYDALTITYIRKDTGVLVETRPMNDVEKQMRIFDVVEDDSPKQSRGGKRRA